MGAQRYVADASGVVRRIKYRYRCDASGVVRRIKRRYIADASGNPRLTFLLGDAFEMVAAVAVSGPPAQIGYIGPAGPHQIGALTPSDGLLGDGSRFFELLSGYKAGVASPTSGYISLALQLIPSGLNTANYITALYIDGPGVNLSLVGPAPFYENDNVSTAAFGWGPGLPEFQVGQTYSVIIGRINA